MPKMRPSPRKSPLAPMSPPPGSLRENTTPNFFIVSTRCELVAAPSTRGVSMTLPCANPASVKTSLTPRSEQYSQDPLGDLVLALRTDALVISAEYEDVPLGGRGRLPVIQFVGDEPDDAFLADVDLRGEELRVDRGEGLGRQLVAEIIGGELTDVPDAREPFDQDGVAKLETFSSVRMTTSSTVSLVRAAERRR